MAVWFTETYLDPWRRQGIERLLLFERVGLSYFPIAAGEILYEIAPELFGATLAEQAEVWEGAARRWWEFGNLGMDDELRTHYWVDVDVPSATWRPTGLHVKKGLQPDEHRRFLLGGLWRFGCSRIGSGLPSRL